MASGETQYGTFHKRTSTAEFLSSTDWIQYIDTTGDTASTSNEYTPNKNNSLTKYLRTLAANVAGISGNTINNGTVGQLAYYSAAGTISGYTEVTTALLKTISDWFDTVKDTDTDANINRWNEIVDFLNNFTEADTLASVLSTYVTLGTAQTITGAKTFANPISGDLLGNSTTADRLKSITAVGSESLPVYFTGGLPVACTASSIFSALSSNTTNAVSITVCGKTRNITPSTLRTSLGLGTVYSHAHTDYVTNVSFDDTNRKLQLSKGDGTATDIVTFGTGAFATIADYLPLSGGTMTGDVVFDTGNTTEKRIYFDINRCVEGGSSWSYVFNSVRDAENSTIFKLGVYGTGSTLTYGYIGRNDYSGTNLRFYSDNLKYGTNIILHAGNYTDYVNSTNFPVLGYTLSGVNNRTINSSTAGYAAYYSDANTVSGTSTLQFLTSNSNTYVNITSSSTVPLYVISNHSDLRSAIGFYTGSTYIGTIGILGNNTTSTLKVAVNTPYFYYNSVYYQLVHSTAKTAVGGSNTPVYVDANGQLQTCTTYSSASVNSATYATNLGTSSAYLTYSNLSGVSGRTINSGTATLVAYYSGASTISSSALMTFDATNSLTTIKGTGGNPLEIWARSENSTLYWSAIKFSSGNTDNKTTLGLIGIGGPASTSVVPSRPFWSVGNTYYQLVHAEVTSSSAAIGSATTAPIYIDSNGEAKVCTSLNINTSGSAGSVKTVTRSTDATHYLTFVDSDNSTATAESIYTDAGITYNPSTNLLTVAGLAASGTVTLNGSTTIDSLTAGNLLVTGNTSLSGNVSLGTVSQGTWNGSVIDVAHGGTGCSTLTSGSALIGNGTGAVTFRSIDNTTTVGSLVNLTTWAASTNLVTRNVIAHWDGRYQTTSNASNLAYCNKGAFGDAATRTYATAISTASGTTSATVNNYNSDFYVPTNKAVYNYVTSTLGVAATIEKTSITKSLNSSTWTETGYTLYGEEQGSYMLQIVDTTTSAVFTGVFSIYHADSATGNDLDEIPLHMCASATNKVRIYAATLNGKLLVSSQDTSATNHALTIKYKKII